MKTSLQNYDLWYDGNVVIPSSSVSHFASTYPNVKLYVDKITPEIEQFNKFVSKSQRISIKTGLNPLDFEWNIPEEYKTLDVEGYLISKLADESLSDDETKIRLKRVLHELKMYTRWDLINMLRCLIYVVSQFEQNNIVWGVGRGSSVSSYILYLIGIHDIDSVEFDLPFSDFLKT